MAEAENGVGAGREDGKIRLPRNTYIPGMAIPLYP
jgi:hypothetical protein